MTLEYPESRRVDHVDTYHNEPVADPYRWLEEDVRESDEVAEWVKSQNRVTHGFLGEIPERDMIRERLKRLWNYERRGVPRKIDNLYVYFRNDGLQDQEVLCASTDLDAEPEVILDPNQWSSDGTIALVGAVFSDNARYLAFGKAEAGSDWQTWHVYDMKQRKVLKEELKWIKFCRPTWTPDGKGFFYTRFDEPESGQAYQSLNLGQKIFYHRVGTDQVDDVLVFVRPDQKQWGYALEVTEDGRYLIITVWKGTDAKHRVLIKDLHEPYGMPYDLIDHFNDDYSFIGNDGPCLYFQTDLEAPRSRVIAIDLRRPEIENWREIVAESEHTLRNVELAGNLLVAHYLSDAHSVIKLFDLEGRHIRDVDLPGIGSVNGFGGSRGELETFFSFSSFNTPSTIYRYNLMTGERSQVFQASVDIDPEDYIVEQVFATSKDGTRVPMFLTRRKDVKADGERPTLLYGYGGFSIPLTPGFSVSRLAWLEMGGVLAIANLRGGGEYGEDWHKAGTRLQKQNVFDDFIACAEHLIANNWTQPKKLAVQGGSNGGLLVGAVMTQRPDLFGACLPAVGVMDMLRFHKFTAGRFWVDDYGSSDDEAEYQALKAYSPYHNLKSGTAYPPTLITTADTDDRVVPMHSFKFAAELQHCHKGDNPVLIRIEERAGHGAGTPVGKQIQICADQWAFLVKTLGMVLECADSN